MKKFNLTAKKNRIWELDFFRGVSVLLVAVEHALWDFGRGFPSWENCGSDFLELLHDVGNTYLTGDLRALWRPAFLFIFFFTSGLCTAFSRNNFMRGVRLTIVAASISIITYFANEIFDSYVFSLFGVLHCMAVIILLYSLVDLGIRLLSKLIDKGFKLSNDGKTERIVHIVVCLALDVAFCIINKYFNVPLSRVTGEGYAMDTDSKILGMFFFCDNWWTTDYFPLFPFIAFFFLGAGCTRILYEKKQSLLPVLDGVWHKPFTFAGRYSLIVYLSGQVIVMGLCALLSIIILGGIS